jgi:hypothetical protein
MARGRSGVDGSASAHEQTETHAGAEDRGDGEDQRGRSSRDLGPRDARESNDRPWNLETRQRGAPPDREEGREECGASQGDDTGGPKVAWGQDENAK